MKKIYKITLCLLCAWVLIPTIALAGSATIYYVAKNGSDFNPGTEAQPWLTIQKAADTLTSGDTVYIKEGIYNEQVTPQNSGTPENYITYNAYPGDTVTINGAGISLSSQDLSALFEVWEKDYIKISGFEIINAGPYQHNAGILIYRSNYIIVENNRTYNTVSSGIGVWGGSNIIVDNNEVEFACDGGEQECITIAGTDTFEVKNNYVHDGGAGTNGGEGIDLKSGASNGKVYGNVVNHLDRLGIYIDAWNKDIVNIEIFRNTVWNNEHGIVVASEQGGSIEGLKIYNNIVYGNEFIGIWIAKWSEASERPMGNIEIVNNTVYKNGIDWGGGILISNPDIESIIVKNNICSCNILSQIAISNDVPKQNIIRSHNLLDGDTWGLGNTEEAYGDNYVEGDPMFANPSQADFHLQENSPAIDSGSSFDAPDDDYDDNPRPEGTNHDMGAYEFVFGVPNDTMAPTPNDNIPPTADAGADVTVNEGEMVSLDGSGSSDPDDGIAAYFWEQTGGPVVDILEPTAGQTSFIALNLTSSESVAFTFELTVQDNGGLTAKDTCVIIVATPASVPGTAILVSPSRRIKDKMPTYTWSEVEGATMYRLYVESPSGTVIDQWYDAHTVTSGDICSVTPDVTLKIATYKWKIRTSNDNGEGNWSKRMLFKVTQ